MAQPDRFGYPRHRFQDRWVPRGWIPFSSRSHDVEDRGLPHWIPFGSRSHGDIEDRWTRWNRFGMTPRRDHR